ncbi:MAG: hypothetical protein O7H41_03435 [Planctomycetota bacterium]|nr:hypothetical protein [Planctomycetota bacterium]
MKPVAVFVREAGEAFGLSRQAAWRRMRKGDFGPVRQLPGGGRMFVLREDFTAAIERMAIEPTAEQLTRKPRRRDLASVPVELDRFLDSKPKRGRK